MDKLVGLSGEWVESTHEGFVGERVLLVLVMNSDVVSNISEDTLDGVGVDDSSKISAFHNRSVESVSLLLDGVVGVVTEDAIEGSESGLGEDEESTEMTTRSELEDVESVDIANINTRQVASILGKITIIIVVDDKRTLAQNITGGSEFTNTSSGVSVVLDLKELIGAAELVEGVEDILGLLTSESINNKREFWDRVNLMATSHNERSASRGSEGRGNGMSSLGDVALSVPFSPNLKGSEHTGLSALVTKGGLTSTRSTRSRNSGNTSNSSTSTPRFGGMFSTSFVENSVTLSSVLREVGVNEMDKIVSDWYAHAGRHRSGSGGRTLGVPDSDSRSCGHILT